jgi:hypothetical protein
VRADDPVEAIFSGTAPAAAAAPTNNEQRTSDQAALFADVVEA